MSEGAGSTDRSAASPPPSAPPNPFDEDADEDFPDGPPASSNPFDEDDDDEVSSPVYSGTFNPYDTTSPVYTEGETRKPPEYTPPRKPASPRRSDSPEEKATTERETPLKSSPPKPTTPRSGSPKEKDKTESENEKPPLTPSPPSTPPPSKLKEIDETSSLFNPSKSTGWGSYVYRFYVLLLLLITYLTNQLDRYLLSVCTVAMAEDLDYGDQTCQVNSSYTKAEINGTDCTSFTEEISCYRKTNYANSTVCQWVYTGTGFEYDLLVGPIFIICYTVAGIPLSLAGDYYNRVRILSLCLIMWSVMTVLTGTVQEYWELALLRFGLGVFEAGCTPFASSIIADYFPANWRASALGVYNWGIYIGYSLAFAVGDYITEADILDLGWRWAFYISGIFGVGVGIILYFTVREPEKRLKKDGNDEADIRDLIGGEEVTWWRRAMVLCKYFCNPTLLVLCLAGSIRNAAGYVWSYYAEVYFELEGQEPIEIAQYLGWIPIVGGVISVLVGGLISDKVASRLGPQTRIMLIAFSLFLAAPFTACVLLVNPPAAYYFLIPAYIIGEVWVGVTLVIVIDLVPTALRTSSIALYFFIISNIAGLGPLCVTPLENAFIDIGVSTSNALKYTLLILYTGGYLVGGLFYLATLSMVQRDIRRLRTEEYEDLDEKE